MWRFEHTETTTAQPEHLWARYADPASWPEWDHGTAAVAVDGPFAVGTTGTLKPTKGPRVRFTLTEVIPPEGFTDVSRLPLARLCFTHRIERTAAGSRFTHGVRITGPLSPLFARVLGTTIAAGLPATMQALARVAEHEQQRSAAR